MRRINQSLVMLTAACVFATTPAGAVQHSNAAPVQAGASAGQQKQEFPKEAQKTLDRLAEAMPFFKELRVEDKFYAETSGFFYPHPIWEVSFTNRPETGGDDKKQYVTVAVEMDAESGRLLSFDIRNPEWASAEYPQEKVARDKADEFLQAFFGKDATQWKASQSLGSGKAGSSGDDGSNYEWARSSVRYSLLINDVPLIGRSLSVSVDAAGHIIRYEAYQVIDSGSAKWPDAKQAISSEKVTAAMRDKLRVKLVYMPDFPLAYDKDGRVTERKPMLVYMSEPINWIDAITGNAIEDAREPAAEKIAVAGKGKPIQLGSREQAETWLKSSMGIDVTGTTFHANEHEDTQEEDWQSIKSYHWFQASAQGKPSFRAVSIVVDAKSNQLIRYDLKLPDDRDVKASVRLEEAKTKAIATLEPYLDQRLTELFVLPKLEETIPDWVDQSKLVKEEDPDYTFDFATQRNGIEVSDETYSVSVDRKSGAITELYLNPIAPGIILPDKEKIIAPEEAAGLFKKEIDAKLVYQWEEFNGQSAPAPRLIYASTSQNPIICIDAVTGKPVMDNMP